MSIKIGKFTLESLTTGMYNDPKIIYREYIQNSVDSIEECIKFREIAEDESEIKIIVNSKEGIITIQDNGIGIPSSISRKTLTNIGDSDKRFDSNRGFRGIGRLGGLSYCDELMFITSSKGENVKSIVTYDAKKLRQLLIPGNMDHMSLSDVINKCVDDKIEEEKKELHYFYVVMKNVDRSTELLDLEIVKDYLIETLPLPFNRKFIWVPKINEIINSKKVKSFNIFVEENGYTTQLFKPYKDKFISNSKSKHRDEINEISEIDIRMDGKTIARGWYAETRYLGGICDETIAGIRMRKGNILIGNGRTLDGIYRQGRFGIWTMGEIHMLDDRFIPNARRDNFEKNELYREFLFLLKESVGETISKQISLQSKLRNDPIFKEIKRASTLASKMQTKLENGFNSSSEKQQLIHDATKSITSLKLNDKKEKSKEIVKELQEISEKVDLSDHYKLNISKASKKEKKVLRVVSEVLNDYLEEETLNIIVEEIRDRLNRRL